jgi:hypothetical protein
MWKEETHSREGKEIEIEIYPYFFFGRRENNQPGIIR